MLYIEDLIISPEQEEHIWTKHHVTVDEVYEVCASHHVARGFRDDSYGVYGQTDAGRYLIVFLYPRGKGVYSVATARDMKEDERRYYQSRSK